MEKVQGTVVEVVAPAVAATTCAAPAFVSVAPTYAVSSVAPTPVV